MQRLRAVRATVDVGLSAGTISPEAAIELLKNTLQMSTTEAQGEVWFHLQTPGQGLSYVAGRAQVLEFLQHAKKTNSKFNIGKFHANLLYNGNMPGFCN